MRSARSSCASAALIVALLAVPDATLAALPKDRNVVLIILDDVGVDLIGAYGEAGPEGNPPTAPPEHSVTPNIDDLAAQGILFRNVWSSPWCSATRATLLTGLYGFRTGVGQVGANLPLPGPSLSYVPLPERLDTPQNGRPERVAIGKWHISSYQPVPPSPCTEPYCLPPYPGDVPTLFGFTRYAGWWDPGGTYYGTPPGGPYGYPWATDPPPPPPADEIGYPEPYLTTQEVQEAIDFVNSAQEPWFLWLALHAAHDENFGFWQDPPPGTYSPTCDTATGGNNQYRDERCRVLEVMDFEVGRLIDTLDRTRTTVIVVGDNGTAKRLPTATNSGQKGGILEGGINVPMIVAGDAVPSGGVETDALVHTVDIHATVSQLTGKGIPTDIDGVSFVSVLQSPGDPAFFPRSCVYADGGFSDPANKAPESHPVAVRNASYKLIRLANGAGYQFYKLATDPDDDAGDTSPATPTECAATNTTCTSTDLYPTVSSVPLPSGYASEKANYDALVSELAFDPNLGTDEGPCLPSEPPPVGCGLLGVELLPTLLLLKALRRRRSP